MGEDGSDGSGAVFDLVAAVREGRLPPVAERPALLQGLANLLVQPRTSVVLLGGRRWAAARWS